VRATSIVVNITNREIHGPIFCVSGGNRHCGLVAAENDWYKHGPLRRRVLSNHILRILDELIRT
jgi:hypothetical protein